LIYHGGPASFTVKVKPAPTNNFHGHSLYTPQVRHNVKTNPAHVKEAVDNILEYAQEFVKSSK